MTSFSQFAVETALYRIFQEVLTNIGKHADPSEVEVTAASRDGQVCFEVRDNGKGFDMHNGWQSSVKAGMGLLGAGGEDPYAGGQIAGLEPERPGNDYHF